MGASAPILYYEVENYTCEIMATSLKIILVKLWLHLPGTSELPVNSNRLINSHTEVKDLSYYG